MRYTSSAGKGRVDGSTRPESPPDQDGRQQEEEGETYLGGQQGGADPTEPASVAVGLAGGQPSPHVGSERADCRNEPSDEARKSRQAHEEECGARAERDVHPVVAPVPGEGPLNEADGEPRHQGAAGRSDRGDQGRLGEDQPPDLRRRRPHGLMDGELITPVESTDQQKVGDVGAGHEDQDENQAQDRQQNGAFPALRPGRR